MEVTAGTNVGLHLGPLHSDKANGGEDDFADMSPLEDASDLDRSSPKQNFSDTVQVLEPGMVVDSHVSTQTKGLDSPLVVDSQEVTVDGTLDTVVVSSLPRESSPTMAHSLALALQNHFSSLKGLKTANEVGGPNTGKQLF